MNKVDLIHISAIDLQTKQFLFALGVLSYLTQLGFHEYYLCNHFVGDILIQIFFQNELF